MHTVTYAHSHPHSLGSATWHSFTKTQKLPEAKREQYYVIPLLNSPIFSAPLNLPDLPPPPSIFICLFVAAPLNLNHFVLNSLSKNFYHQYQGSIVASRKASSMPCMAIFNEAWLHLSHTTKMKTQFCFVICSGLNPTGPLPVCTCN